MEHRSSARCRAGLAAIIAVAALAAPIVAPPPGVGDQPNDLTISASRDRVTYGGATAISGRLKTGLVRTGVLVTLQANPAPYSGGFQDVGTTTTDSQGRYRFDDVGPEQSTRYRVRTTLPSATSAELLVEVRFKVALRLSDSTPRRGQRVTFSGTVGPEHDGRLVYFQRRTASGNWRTFKRTVLKDAGSEFSKYARKVKIRRSGTYRAKVFHDSDHVDGTSRPKRTIVIG